MIRLAVDSNGRLRFADGVVSDEARGRSYAEGAARRREYARRRASDERLHAEHMRFVGVTDDPTRARLATREVPYEARGDDEEKLWQAWQRRSGW